MNPIVSFLISGRVLFPGLGLMVLLALTVQRIQSPALRRLLIAQIWSLAVISLSTAALPWWGLVLFAIALTFWTTAQFQPPEKRLRLASECVLLTAILAVLLTELPWTRASEIPVANQRALVVIGDSLSAGLGEGEGTPWPRQLADQHNVPVINLSQAGATTRDGLAMTQKAWRHPGLVLVELGGNDLLGGRTLNDYEADLAKILKSLQDQKRSVVMVELPLLPSRNAWGVTQRRLATQFHAALLPKRKLVDVLSAPGSTVDTLHLSQMGHQRMAVMVWETIRSALPAAREQPANLPQRPVPSAAPEPSTALEPQLTAMSAPSTPRAPSKTRAPSLDEIVLFQPSRSGNWHPQGLVHQDVEFTAADGTQLHGWYCPADHPRAAVLYCHGNGGNIAGLAGLLEYLRRNHHLSVLAFDYRGYGKSQGLPTVEGVIADGEAARAKLADLSDVPVSDQLLWGHSMGGAVAVQLARKRAPRALILESTFDSFQSVARHHAPQWAFLIQPGKLDSVGCISQITCPLFQLHGTADRVVPYAMGVNLFRAANEPKQFLMMDGVDHNDRIDESTFQTIDTFIDQHCATSRR